MSSEEVRVVAVCQGHRCRALLAAQQPAGLTVLREATGRSARGVLVTTPCPGLCTHGPVATVGPGRIDAGRALLDGAAVVGPLDATSVATLAGVLDGPGPLVLPDELQQLALALVPQAAPAEPRRR